MDGRGVEDSLRLNGLNPSHDSSSLPPSLLLPSPSFGSTRNSVDRLRPRIEGGDNAAVAAPGLDRNGGTKEVVACTASGL